MVPRGFQKGTRGDAETGYPLRRVGLPLDAAPPNPSPQLLPHRLWGLPWAMPPAPNATGCSQGTRGGEVCKNFISSHLRRLVASRAVPVGTEHGSGPQTRLQRSSGSPRAFPRLHPGKEKKMKRKSPKLPLFIPTPSTLFPTGQNRAEVPPAAWGAFFFSAGKAAQRKATSGRERGVRTGGARSRLLGAHRQGWVGGGGDKAVLQP